MASSPPRAVDANLPLRLAVTAICLFALLLRYATSLHPYSGHAAPPMYGDYEAHRHWMEVTINLPVSEWYVQSADNDLQYWGIDYPPLSAYLSWVFGRVAARTHPDLVALHASRGHESAASKLFMRSSVLSMDVLVFFPAALLLAHARGLAPSARLLALGGLLLQPALILVDHGHFQYNCVSLGLALGAQALTLSATDDGGSHGSGQGKGEGWPLARCLLPAAVLFCLSLNFKQMSLYYAPAFFCHMLGLCLRRRTLRQRFASVAALGITVSHCRAQLPRLMRVLPPRRSHPLPWRALPFHVPGSATALVPTRAIRRPSPLARRRASSRPRPSSVAGRLHVRALLAALPAPRPNGLARGAAACLPRAAPHLRRQGRQPVVHSLSHPATEAASARLGGARAPPQPRRARLLARAARHLHGCAAEPPVVRARPRERFTLLLPALVPSMLRHCCPCRRP